MMFTSVVWFFLFVAPPLVSSYSSRSVRPSLQCPDGFIGLGEKCYFFGNIELDYTSASSFCHQRESTLVEMETRSEIDILKIYRKLVDPSCALRSTWTGGFWSILTQTFVWWSTGQEINVFDWTEGQPDHVGPEDKVYVDCWYDLTWQDYPGVDGRAGPICEKHPLTTKREAPETAVISPSLACPSSFFPLGDFCYLLEKEEFGTWSQAATNCKTKGGYLAEFNSRMEVDLSLLYLQAEHKDCLTWSMGSIWIGAMEVDNSTIFSWARNQTEMVATNWDEDFQEPNGPEALNVVAMVCAWNFEWFDFKPDSNRNYLCEADPISA